MAEILSGWKDIANYMGKGVRTVQRYGRELGLPVRRAFGKPKASVLVTKAELDEWIRAAFNHKAANEKLLPDLERVKSRTSELRATLEQFQQSMQMLAQTQNELAVSLRTIRQTGRQVHHNVFPTPVPPKAVVYELP